MHSIAEHLECATLDNLNNDQTVVEMADGHKIDRDGTSGTNEKTQELLQTSEDNGDNVSMSDSEGKDFKIRGKK